MVAWQIPNSYRSELHRTSLSRQKKINKRINLVTKRAQGSEDILEQIYYPTLEAAIKAYVRDPTREVLYVVDQAPGQKSSDDDGPDGAAHWGLLEAIP